MAAPTATLEPAAPTYAHPALRQQQVSRVPYLPGLDGMRAIAVIAVIVYHANHTWLSGGFLGVEVFFVISGYLITLLLIGEHERTGRVRLGRFWLRRARRLLPALFTMMTGVAIYMAFFARRPMGANRGDFVAGTFYGSNWYQLWVGLGYTDFEAFAPMRHLWSLAVEEQFYLLWPLVMILLLRRRADRLPRVALWLVIASATIAVAIGSLFVSGDIESECSASMHGYWRVFGHCINTNEFLYLSTFTRMSGVLLGAALAMVWRPVAVMRGPLRNKARTIDVVALLSFVGLMVMFTQVSLAEPATNSLFGTRYDGGLFRGGLFFTGVCTVGLIMAATHRRSWMGRLLGIRPLNWVGTRSYGLYLYHWPIIQILREPGQPLDVTSFAIAMLITVPVAEISYRVIELPVRQGRLGEWLRGERPPRTRRAAARRRRFVLLCGIVAMLGGFAAVSVATAQVLCVGEVACSLAPTAAADPVSVPTTAPSPPPVSEPVVAADGSLPETTTTTIDPLAAMPPVAIGESVMLGAAPQLQAGGFIVNAAVSRQGKNVAEVVEMMRAAGQIGRTIVIQTGTNGSVSDETLARIMAQLPPEATPHVYFLTVKAPRGWIADNNTRIRNLPNVYPNVTIIDWEAASAGIAGELSRSDGGIHLSTANAKQYYANMIFQAIGRPDLVR